MKSKPSHLTVPPRGRHDPLVVICAGIRTPFSNSPIERGSRSAPSGNGIPVEIGQRPPSSTDCGPTTMGIDPLNVVVGSTRVSRLNETVVVARIAPLLASMRVAVIVILPKNSRCKSKKNSKSGCVISTAANRLKGITAPLGSSVVISIPRLGLLSPV